MARQSQTRFPNSDVDDLVRGIVTAIAVLATLALVIKYIVGHGTKKWRNSFIASILLIMVIIQYYFLFRAGTVIPSTYDADLFTLRCTISDKGGKRIDDSETLYDRNPCMCSPELTCLLNEDPENTDVPCNFRQFRCLQGDGTKVDKYIESSRDCSNAVGAYCTQSEPCTPCEPHKLRPWVEASLRENNHAALPQAYPARCVQCNVPAGVGEDRASGIGKYAGPYKDGDCHFVEGVGPYCWDRPDSKKVVPCSRCCSDPQELIFINGSCY